MGEVSRVGDRDTLPVFSAQLETGSALPAVLRPNGLCEQCLFLLFSLFETEYM